MDPNALPAHFQIDYIRAYSVDPTAKAVALQPISSPDGVNTTPVLALTNTVGSGADTLLLRLSEDAYQGHAQFTVSVDGKQVGGTLTATASHAAGQTETVAVQGDWGIGSHTVSVTFRNDLWDDGGDRNLYLDGAIYNGTTIAYGASGNVYPAHQFSVQDLSALPGTLSVADAGAAEGNSGTAALSFAVSLSQASSTPVTVRWDTLTGTAAVGTDFGAAGGVLTFAPGQTTASVAVNLLGDTMYEPDETFRLVLSTPTGATLARAEAVGTIRNDDAVPPPDEVITGSSGIDTARLAIGFRDTSVATSAGLPSHVTGGGHSYALTGVEVLHFVDGRLVFDPTDPAAQVVRLYNAALARAPDQDGLNHYV
ncbi:Calx-beta domain-containing protein, partial [Roseomonas sp. BN140053]|uniref:Calx-beta domain-containing protein n=1 Tax=Roseomonas sp. BN140053 TaxID=3391898 RepID=UPI0039E76B8A